MEKLGLNDDAYLVELVNLPKGSRRVHIGSGGIGFTAVPLRISLKGVEGVALPKR